MIQRQQTLWLLLVVIACVLSFLFPFVTGKGMKDGLIVDRNITADSHFLIMILTGASLLLSMITIFLYKDRPLQAKLCILGLLLTLGIIVLYVLELRKLDDSTIALFAILPFLMLLGYYFAFRGIRRDDKLVKSLEKLR